VGCFRFVGAPDLLYGDHPHFWLKNGDVHRTGYLDIWGYGRAGRRVVPDLTGDCSEVAWQRGLTRFGGEI